MILIPERKIIVILTPRTGTRALKRAIAERYPDSIMLYRHMEADGVPHGYDRWSKVGVVRNPVERLWSLYKYLKRFGLDFCEEHDATYTLKMRQSVERSFDDWLMNNEQVFTSPYDSAGMGRLYPLYTVRHPLPENRKSQFIYLRPDLGTRVFNYSEIAKFYDMLDVVPGLMNATSQERPPILSPAAVEYVERWFSWDLWATGAKALAA